MTPALPTSLRLALGLFTLTTVVFWLPTVRGLLDGESYRWVLFGLAGRGITGDYWFPALGSLAALAVRAGALAERRWATALVALWNTLVFVAVAAAAWSNPDDFRLRGDTLGLDLSLVWIGPLLMGFAAGTSIAALSNTWTRNLPPCALAAGNVRWLVALGAMLPCQLVLLRFGGDGLSDQLGVIVTIAQWLLFGRALRPGDR